MLIVDDADIRETRLDNTTVRILRHEGITTLQELANCRVAKLSDKRLLGEKRMHRIKNTIWEITGKWPKE